MFSVNRSISDDRIRKRLVERFFSTLSLLLQRCLYQCLDVNVSGGGTSTQMDYFFYFSGIKGYFLDETKRLSFFQSMESWSIWRQWTACPVTCGTSKQDRTRTWNSYLICIKHISVIGVGSN